MFGKKKIDVKKGKINRKKEYNWEGRNKKGKKVSGITPSFSSQELRVTLLEQHITPTKIKAKQDSIFGKRKAKIKSNDIALLTRQISTMIKSGIPIVKTLDIVADGTDNETMKDLVIDIKNEIESGNSFANALKKHPKHFDSLYCSLVSAAEEAGALDDIFDSIALYKEKTEMVKRKIKKAMMYPISILVVAAVVTMILLLKVVPQFEQMFNNFGAKLPAFTQMVLDMSAFVQANWVYMIGSGAGAFFIFKKLKEKSLRFNHSLERLSLKIPVINPLIRKSAIARFTRTLSTTSKSGLKLIDGLDSAAGAAGNVVYTNAVFDVKEEVSNGQTLSFALQSTGLFPSMIVQMTGIGEESGNLDEMLAKVATLYEDEVDQAVDGITSLMEPFIMVFLGVVVGGLVISMYLPIFKMGAAV